MGWGPLLIMIRILLASLTSAMAYSHSVASTSTVLLPSSLSPADGSRTITVTTDPTKEEGQSDSSQEQTPGEAPARVLRLRGAKRAGPRVAWDDDVVDNEHMGKKKSKSTPLSLHLAY